MLDIKLAKGSTRISHPHVISFASIWPPTSHQHTALVKWTAMEWSQQNGNNRNMKTASFSGSLLRFLLTLFQFPESLFKINGNVKVHYNVGLIFNAQVPNGIEMRRPKTFCCGISFCDFHFAHTYGRFVTWYLLLGRRTKILLCRFNIFPATLSQWPFSWMLCFSLIHFAIA